MDFLTILHIFATFALISAVREGKIIRNPGGEDRGVWGTWDNCTKNSYVVGMSMKLDLRVKFGFVNGIRFYCSDFKKPNQIVGQITSLPACGSYAIFHQDFFCDNGFVVGFLLCSDGTTASNLKIICSNGDTIEGDGKGDTCKWTPAQKCRPREAVCALHLQGSERHKGHIYNVEMMCCPIPNPDANCTPKDEWEEILSCDNRKGIEDFTCSYSLTVGSTMSSQTSSSGFERSQTSMELGFGFDYGIKGVSSKIQTGLRKSKDTGTEWNKQSTDTFEMERTHEFTAEISPGRRTVVNQAVAKCGNYNVRASRIKTTDSP